MASDLRPAQRKPGRIERTGWVSLTQAVTWVAFGRMLTAAEAAAERSGGLDWPDRFLTPAWAIESLDARLQRDRQWIAQQRANDRDNGLPGASARNLRWLRQRFRISGRDLLAHLRGGVAARADWENRWNAAARQLFEAANHDPPRVRLRGRRADASALEPIPPLLFAEPHLVAAPGDRLACDVDAPMALWVENRARLTWRDVTVHRADLLAAFPPRRPGCPDPAELAKLMLAMQAAAKPRLKRDAALAHLRKETGCTAREALAAWNALPSDLRGTRGNRPV